MMGAKGGVVFPITVTEPRVAPKFLWKETCYDSWGYGIVPSYTSHTVGLGLDMSPMWMLTRVSPGYMMVEEVVPFLKKRNDLYTARPHKTKSTKQKSRGKRSLFCCRIDERLTHHHHLCYIHQHRRRYYY